MTVDQALERLARSPFRSRFRLDEADRAYVEKKGLAAVRDHARAFVAERLTPAEPKNDGKQTPMRGHPVFKAQHACACCCRGCLEKWYRVPKGRALSEAQQEKIVALLMAWIEKQLQNNA